MTRIMRHSLGFLLFSTFGLADQLIPEAKAQVVVGGPVVATPYRMTNYFAAPGYYGTSYGYASFGVPRTYTTFSAYPGAAYGVNYPAYGVLPGYGAGLWRRGVVTPGVVYGPGYSTFPVGVAPSFGGPRVVTPPIGVYAPAFGPGYRPYFW